MTSKRTIYMPSHEELARRDARRSAQIEQDERLTRWQRERLAPLILQVMDIYFRDYRRLADDDWGPADGPETRLHFFPDPHGHSAGRHVTVWVTREGVTLKDKLSFGARWDGDKLVLYWCGESYPGLDPANPESLRPLFERADHDIETMINQRI